MPWHDLPLPPAIARLIELLLQAVGRGARQAGRLLGDGHLIRTRMIVRRVSAILRHVILMLAVRLELAPPRTRAARSTPIPEKSAHGGGGAAAPIFHLWSSIPAARHSEGAQRHSESVSAGEVPQMRSLDECPWTLNGAARLQGDGLGEATILKQLHALRAALDNPLRLARRLARKLRGDGIFLPPKVPRTIPKTCEREFWEELVTSAEEARFAFGEYWRMRRDTS